MALQYLLKRAGEEYQKPYNQVISMNMELQRLVEQAGREYPKAKQTGGEYPNSYRVYWSANNPGIVSIEFNTFEDDQAMLKGKEPNETLPFVMDLDTKVDEFAAEVVTNIVYKKIKKIKKP